MNTNDMVIKYCPHCDSPCLISQNQIDAEQAENKTVTVACHQCAKQFFLEGDQKKADGIDHLARIKVANCPSCQKPITIPKPLPDLMTVDLFCPLCDKKLDLSQALPEKKSVVDELKPSAADKIIPHKDKPEEKLKTSYMPLYMLLIICIIAFIFWANETGHLPIDTWLKILE